MGKVGATVGGHGWGHGWGHAATALSRASTGREEWLHQRAQRLGAFEALQGRHGVPRREPPQRCRRRAVVGQHVRGLGQRGVVLVEGHQAQRLGGVPARAVAALFAPHVVHAARTAIPDHAVDQSRPADAPAARASDVPVGGVALLLCRIAPVHRRREGAGILHRVVHHRLVQMDPARLVGGRTGSGGRAEIKFFAGQHSLGGGGHRRAPREG